MDRAKEIAQRLREQREAEKKVRLSRATKLVTTCALRFRAVQAEQEKRTDKKRRRAENELRSASYQVVRDNSQKGCVLTGIETPGTCLPLPFQISDPTKLKKMSKKQLRSIKRTRLNPETGVVEFVGAYSRG